MTSTLPRPMLVLIALAAVIGGFVTSAPTSSSATVPFPDIQRIEGTNAVAISVAVSQELFEDGSAEAVVLARSDAFPDSLSAAGFAAAANAPILFTGRTTLNAGTRTEIERVLTSGRFVYLLGGEAALSQQIEDEIVSMGYRASRFAGSNRLQTAALVANALLFQTKGDTVLLARAFGDPDLTQGWVDSVSCGGFAADRELPIVLTDPRSATLASQTRSLITQRDIRTVHVCGGAAAVPEAHLQELRDLNVNVVRHFGQNRAETAVAVAKELWGAQRPNGRTFTLVPGFGDRFPYGVAASQLSARHDAPILLVDATTPTGCGSAASAATICYLRDRTAPGAGAFVVGGQDIIADKVATAAGDALGLERDSTPPSPAPEFVEAIDVPEDDGTQASFTWSLSSDANGVSYEIYYRDPEKADRVPADCVPQEPSEGGSESASESASPQPTRDPDSEYCQPRDPNATESPSEQPTEQPSGCATEQPSASETPTAEPSPSETPTAEPSASETPSQEPCPEPEPEPELVPVPLTPETGTRAVDGPFTETVTTEDGTTLGTGTVTLCQVQDEVDEEGNPTGGRSAPCAGVPFDFIVVALDPVGNFAQSQVVSMATSDETPAAPEAAPATGAESGGQTRVSWVPSASADAAGYVVERGDQIFTEDDPFDNTKGCEYNGFIFTDEVEYSEIARVEVPITTFLDTTTSLGGEYCYRYAVIDTTGNVSGYSPAAAYTR